MKARFSEEGCRTNARGCGVESTGCPRSPGGLYELVLRPLALAMRGTSLASLDGEFI